MVEAKADNELPEEQAAKGPHFASAGFILQGVAKAARGFAIYLAEQSPAREVSSKTRQKVEDHLEEFRPPAP